MLQTSLQATIYLRWLFSPPSTPISDRSSQSACSAPPTGHSLPSPLFVPQGPATAAPPPPPIPPTLKVFPPRHRNKHSNQHPPNHRPTQQALHKDGILNLPQRRLPDPNLPIKHLPHHVPPLIFHNPRLALKAIPRPKALERPLPPRRSLLDLLPLSQKQLPRPHMSMMHPMQHDTHPLPRRHQRRRPQHPPDRRQRAPPARARRQRQQHRGNDTRDDQSCAEDAREEYPRRVAVADGPADEVGVGLAAEGGLDGADDVAQRRGVRGVGEGVEGGFLLAVREV